MTRASSQAALDRRCAAAALAGAGLGREPWEWLIRNALDDYLVAAAERLVARLTPETRLLRVNSHELWLDPWNPPRILVERDARRSFVRSYKASPAAVVLFNEVRDDPARTERLLVAIEAAAKGARYDAEER